MRRALVWGPRLPDHDRQSGSRRLYDFLCFLREDGWAVTFAAKTGGEERYARELRALGIATHTNAEKEIGEIVRHGRFDLAVLAFWEVAGVALRALRQHSPHTRVIVDSVDLHFLRHARSAFESRTMASENGEDRRRPGTLDDAYGVDFARELNVYGAADRVLAVSEKEADLINDLARDPELATALPDCESSPPSPYGFHERSGILFIGNFRHPPNVGALEFLCREIVPRLPADVLGQNPVRVVGNAFDENLAVLCDGAPGVEPVGWVPSVVPYIERSRVSVVPLLYGAGTKRKLIQALTIGTPTVSTTTGVEGLEVSDGSEVLVADEPEAFARSIERLATDEDLWLRLVEGGRRRVQGTHAREHVRALFRDLVDRVLAKPAKAAPASAAKMTLEPRGRKVRTESVAQPVFIVGAPRSGTSVLTWSLGQHPDLLPLEESDWLPRLVANLTIAYRKGTARGDRSALSAMGVSQRAFYAAFGDAVDEIILSHRRRYEELHAAKGGDPRFTLSRSPSEPKLRWVDGSPHYSRHIYALSRLFPGARFVHLLRDVESVTRSLIHFHKVGGPRFSWQQAYERWLEYVAAAVEAEKALGSETVLRISHADLTRHPETAVRRCLEFLGEPFAPACLEPLTETINSSSLPSDRSGDPPLDVDPGLKLRAEELSGALLAEATPSYRADPGRRAVLERSFQHALARLEGS
ncbi:MAG TPA: sulfotransferase [Thermoleophilaceae bacterium]|nr:sulfotransferase [Thermoleophilaceae bacterium]